MYYIVCSIVYNTTYNIIHNTGIYMTTITFETVSAAAAALVNEDQKPTLVNIRTALGGGSFSTISPLLKQWRDSQAAVTAAAPMVEAAPDEITEQVNGLAGHIWQAAMNLANARLVTEREALEQTRLSLEAERDEAAELADYVAADLEKITVENYRLQQDLDTERQALLDSQNQTAVVTLKLQERDQELRSEIAEKKSSQARADELAELLSAEQAARGRVEAEASTLHDREKVLTEQVATLRAKLEAADAANHSLQQKLTNASTELVHVSARSESASVRLEAAALDVEKAENATSIAQAEAKKAGERAAELRGRIAELEKQLKSKATPPTQAALIK
jgi:chromosome segregation ATPase